MTINEMYQIIAKEKPSVIYVSGKTCTGKSTFGRKLRDQLAYQVIELEAVLIEMIKDRGCDEQSTFRKVLYESSGSEEKHLFLEATNRIISDALAKKRLVVIEGAVANVVTLQRILQPAKGLLFLYFHPKNLDTYVRNLTNRFMQSNEKSYGGLPLTFWQFVDDEAFKTFCKQKRLSEGLEDSIRKYALNSQQDSSVRLNEFQEKFRNIIVVES